MARLTELSRPHAAFDQIGWRDIEDLNRAVRRGSDLMVWTGESLIIPGLTMGGRSLDFAHDTVPCGRAIRVLSVVDAYTRECLALAGRFEGRLAIDLLYEFASLRHQR